MALRDRGFIEQLSRAESDLLGLKNAQLFGKDVTRPKVIQRYNSDGSPTEWDVYGAFDSVSQQYKIGGVITYTANTQESPWAQVYVKLRINPGDVIVSEYSAGFNAYPNFDQIFSGGKRVTFEVYGSSSYLFGPPADPTVDRIWAKIYILATDYGALDLNFPSGENGSGTVVPLT